MRRGIGVLLTCAWVLWSASFDMKDWKYSVSDAYGTKTECEQGGQQLLGYAVMGGGKLSGNAVLFEKKATLLSYKCLPDTVKP